MGKNNVNPEGFDEIHEDQDIEKYYDLHETPSTFRKSNTLIGAKYRSTLLEGKLSDLGMYEIQHDNYKINPTNNALVVEFTASQLRGILGIKGASFYKHLKETSIAMTSRPMLFEDPEKGEFVVQSIISKASYVKGVYSIQYDAEFGKYLLRDGKGIDKQYAVLDLPQILSFKSNHTYRVYQLLKRRAFTKKEQREELRMNKPPRHVVNYKISELKLELGIVNPEEDAVKKILQAGGRNPDYDKAVSVARNHDYKEWRDFKRRVLDVAATEINESSLGMHVDFRKQRARKNQPEIVQFYVVYSAEVEEWKKYHSAKNQEFIDEFDSDIIDTDNFNEQNIDETEEVVETVNAEVIEDSPVEISVTKKKRVIAQMTLLFSDEEIEVLGDEDIESIAKAANYDLEKIEKAYKVMSEDHNEITNIVGFMINSIRKDHTPNSDKGGRAAKTSTNHFNEIERNDYDMERLEDLLLNNKR